MDFFQYISDIIINETPISFMYLVTGIFYARVVIVYPCFILCYFKNVSCATGMRWGHFMVNGEASWQNPLAPCLKIPHLLHCQLYCVLFFLCHWLKQIYCLVFEKSNPLFPDFYLIKFQKLTELCLSCPDIPILLFFLVHLASMFFCANLWGFTLRSSGAVPVSLIC